MSLAKRRASDRELAKRFSDAFPPELAAQLKAEATRVFPKEAVGLIVAFRNKPKFIVGRNISLTPEKTARLHPDDYETAIEQGKLLFHFHSHCNERATPSPGDKTMSEKHELPLVIMALPTEEVQFYFPNGWRAPLLGRPFVYGSLGCYELVQDHYEEELAIKLPNFDSEEDWWNKGQNLLMDNFAKAGFRIVKDLKRHDVLLIHLKSPVPNHCAVYLGDGMILHHVPWRLSCLQPFHEDQGYYAHNLHAIIRHESRD